MMRFDFWDRLEGPGTSRGRVAAVVAVGIAAVAMVLGGFSMGWI